MDSDHSCTSNAKITTISSVRNVVRMAKYQSPSLIASLIPRQPISGVLPGIQEDERNPDRDRFQTDSASRSCPAAHVRQLPSPVAPPGPAGVRATRFPGAQQGLANPQN